MDVKHNMHDNLPVIAAMFSALTVLVIKNMQIVLSILLDHKLLASINLAQIFEVSFYSAWGAVIGYLIKVGMDVVLPYGKRLAKYLIQSINKQRSNEKEF